MLRQGPPDDLLTHLRRWQRLQLFVKCFVEFNGKSVASVKKGFSEVDGKVTPHTCGIQRRNGYAAHGG
jgi:hypothetical protein